MKFNKTTNLEFSHSICKEICEANDNHLVHVVTNSIGAIIVHIKSVVIEQIPRTHFLRRFSFPAQKNHVHTVSLNPIRIREKSE